MKKAKKIFSIFAVLGAVLLVAGIVAFACSWPYGKGSAAAYSDRVKQELNVEKTFSSAGISKLSVVSAIPLVIKNSSSEEFSVKAAGVYIRPSLIGGKLNQTAEAANGTLAVDFGISSWWGFISMGWQSSNTAALEITIPASYRGDLFVEQQQDDAVLQTAGITFKNATIRTFSGSLSGGLTASGNAVLELTSGSMNLSGVQAESVTADVTSGSMTLDMVETQSFSLDVSSGKFATNYLSAPSVDLELTSGNIQMKSVYCDRLKLDATSGKTSVALARPANVEMKLTSGSAIFDMPKPEDLRMQVSFLCTSGSFYDNFYSNTRYQDDIQFSFGPTSSPLYQFTAAITSGKVTLNKI